MFHVSCLLDRATFGIKQEDYILDLGQVVQKCRQCLNTLWHLQVAQFSQEVGAIRDKLGNIENGNKPVHTSLKSDTLSSYQSIVIDTGFDGGQTEANKVKIVAIFTFLYPRLSQLSENKRCDSLREVRE